MTSDMLRASKSRTADRALVVSSHGSRASAARELVVGSWMWGVGRRASGVGAGKPVWSVVVGLRLEDSVKKKTKKRWR